MSRHPNLRSGSRGSLSHGLALARRATLGLWRHPNNWVFATIFPLLIAAVQSSSFSRSVALEGFPEVDSFPQFMMPMTIMQAVLYGSATGGSELALDMEGGFFDRLIVAPTSRTAILFGQLSGVAAMVSAQTLLFIAVFVAFGTRLEGGVAAAAILVLIAALLTFGLGGLVCAIALRTGSAEAVGNLFPLVFVLLFLSSAFFPVELMRGWYRSVAANNPLTWFIDSLRHQIVVGLDIGSALASLAGAAALIAVTFSIAVRALQRRLRVAS